MAIQLEDLVARLRLDSSGLSSGLAGVNSSLASAGASATQAGRRMTVGLTAPITAIGVASVNLAGTFDKTMRQVSVATDGPTDKLKALAMQMGAETAFSANEAADAMLELAKGGMTAVQIQGGALAATMKLASAGGVGLAEASTYVSNSMAAFGLKAKDADSVTVALAGAANASSASVESLGQGLSQAALASRNAGLSLQETTGVLSLFDSQGLKGSDAGTSLKSALNSLIPTTDKAGAAMEAAGLDFVKGNGQFESVANIAEQLQNGLGDLTQAQRAQALETIFGSDGMRAATVLMNGGREAVEKYTKASRDQETTTKLADAAMQGVSGSIERAKGSMETVALVIGTVLAPYVERLAGVVEQLANKFVNLPGPLQGIIVAVAALAAAIGPILIVIGALSSGMAVVSGAFAAASAAATAAGGGLAGVSAALGVLISPVLLVGLALAGVAAAFYFAYTRSAEFRDVVTNALAAVSTFIATSVIPAAQSIATAFMGLVAAVTPIVMQLVAIVQQNMPQIMETVRSVFEAVKSIILGVMTVVQATISKVASVITTLWGVFGETILSTVSKVFPAILNVIQGVMKIIQGVIKVVTSAITGDWSGVWEGIKQIVSGAWQAIGGIVSGGVALVKGAFSLIIDALVGIAKQVWADIKQTFSDGVGVVVGVVEGLKSKIMNVFGAPLTLLSTIGSQIVQGLVNGITGAYDAVIGAVQGLIDKIPGPIRKAMGIASPSKVMAEIGRYISQGLAKGLVGGQSEVRDSMQGLIELLRKANKDGLVKLASDTQKNLLEYAKKFDFTVKQLDKLRDKLQQMKDDAQALRESVAATIIDTGSLADVTGKLDEEGNELPITSDDVVEKLANATARAEEFNAVLAQLQTAGLEQSVIDELRASGPASLEEAQAILAGGQAAIVAINALQLRLIAAGQAAGESAATSMYGAGIMATQGLIDGLEAQQGALVTAMEKLADKMIKALKKKLKMKSPSRVMEQLGVFTGEGFANGVSSMVSDVARVGERLAGAVIVEPPTAQLAAAQAAAMQLGTRSFGALGQTQQPVAVRVFIGDRELTDIVRVEIGETFTPVRDAIRTGAL